MGIQVDHISFSYGNKPVLSDITETIADGEFISIVGPNGGGKTTFLKILLGILEPQKGTVLVDGKSPASQLQRIGYVPQSARHDARFPINILEVVQTGLLSYKKISRKDKLAACFSALEEVDMQDLACRHFSEISGGQRQRVLIARALVSSPQYLFLDEPTANVDSIIGEQLHALLSKLSGKRTIVLVTHDLSLVSSLSHRVFCINRHLHIHPLDEIDDHDSPVIRTDILKRVRHDITLNSELCSCEEHTHQNRESHHA